MEPIVKRAARGCGCDPDEADDILIEIGSVASKLLKEANDANHWMSLVRRAAKFKAIDLLRRKFRAFPLEMLVGDESGQEERGIAIVEDQINCQYLAKLFCEVSAGDLLMVDVLMNISMGMTAKSACREVILAGFGDEAEEVIVEKKTQLLYMRFRSHGKKFVERYSASLC